VKSPVLWTGKTFCDSTLCAGKNVTVIQSMVFGPLFTWKTTTMQETNTSLAHKDALLLLDNSD